MRCTSWALMSPTRTRRAADRSGAGARGLYRFTHQRVVVTADAFVHGNIVARLADFQRGKIVVAGHLPRLHLVLMFRGRICPPSFVSQHDWLNLSIHSPHFSSALILRLCRFTSCFFELYAYEQGIYPGR